MDKNSFVELSNGGFAFNTSQNDPQTGQMIYESLSVDMEQSLLISNKNGNSAEIRSIEYLSFNDAEIKVSEILTEIQTKGFFKPKSNFEYSILGLEDDYFIGDGDADWIETGGGSDEVYAGAGDDIVKVQGSAGSLEETFTITVSSTPEGNKYFVNGEQQATLSLQAGKTYIFDQSHGSNVLIPLAFP